MNFTDYDISYICNVKIYQTISTALNVEMLALTSSRFILCSSVNIYQKSLPGNVAHWHVIQINASDIYTTTILNRRPIIKILPLLQSNLLSIELQISMIEYIGLVTDLARTRNIESFCDWRMTIWHVKWTQRERLFSAIKDLDERRWQFTRIVSSLN